MLYSSGTTGRPKGDRQPLRRAAGRSSRVAAASQFFAACSASTRTPSTSRRRRSTTRRRCASAWPCHALGGTVVSWSTSTRRRALALIETLPGHAQPVGADDVRAHAQAAGRASAALRPVEPCTSPSTPRRPARSPVKEQMIDWWGPILYEYYAGTEGVGVTRDRRRRSGSRTAARSARARRRHDPHPRRGRQRTAARRDRARLLRAAAACRSSTTTTPTRRAARYNEQRLATARRRRLPRRATATST